jgi:hypothetical protein
MKDDISDITLSKVFPPPSGYGSAQTADGLPSLQRDTGPKPGRIDRFGHLDPSIETPSGAFRDCKLAPEAISPGQITFNYRGMDSNHEQRLQRALIRKRKILIMSALPICGIFVAKM